MTCYKHFLFDLDETLLDFQSAEERAFREVMEDFSIPCSAAASDFYKKTNDGLWKRLERKEITKDKLFFDRFNYTCAFALGKDPADPTLPDAFKVNRRYMETFSQYGFFLPGAEEMLTTIRNASAAEISIITNGTLCTANGRIKSSGVDRYASHIFISDQIGVDKPDKRFFEHVIATIGDPDLTNYLVIGDSLSSDIKGANNSGMDACLFTHMDHFPTVPENITVKYKASGFDELTSLLIHLAAREN